MWFFNVFLVAKLVTICSKVFYVNNRNTIIIIPQFGPHFDSASRVANNESSEVFDIIKPGRRVKIKGYRQ